MAITIPEEWAREHGIKKGDELALTANSMLSAVKSKELPQMQGNVGRKPKKGA